jgi:hypothetical protein
MRIYIHTQGRQEPEAIDVAAGSKLDELAQAHEGEVVMVEDGESPLDLQMTVTEAGLGARSHVFVGAAQHVWVEINFNGQLKSERFSSAHRVERVFRWATSKHGFGLSDADAAEHILALCGSGTTPPSDKLLGSLLAPGEERLCFNLIPKHRFEG